MKKVLIICGTGVATSTVVAAKVREHLEAEGIGASVVQGKVMDLVGGEVDADLIVATTEVPAAVTVPVIRALPLLTGIGQEATLDEIARALS
ncbi:PTS galactitol transporter subunit IIB [Brachybacterium ginsengisoli]|uniref:PTS galactitol transporter subunit IIB n=1 Tax=Brachybacterium ginsengisoli TaxID=1331682 RepID=A0A291H0U4_9MICO|nr:PTS sugar transporter subunit IIB [Brachybacterium ginsengisoli]ATG55984.1 PTS galactitol transporter subunit IIB [Brachybacterium ginsengisoli]